MIAEGSTIAGATGASGTLGTLASGLGGGIAAIGGSLLSAGSSIWNGMTGAGSAHETNEYNKEIAMWNWLQNQQINRDNLNFQREALDYQKALNEEIFNREDTAYQRTVEDMRKAGLNPLTMTGTNGSGGQVSPTQPLQMGNNNFDYQKQDEFREINFANTLATAIETLSQYQNLSLQEAQIKKLNAEARLAESDADWEDFITPIDKEYENWDRYFRMKENYHNFYWGYTPNMTDGEKAKRLLEYIANPKDYIYNEQLYDERYLPDTIKDLFKDNEQWKGNFNPRVPYYNQITDEKLHDNAQWYYNAPTEGLGTLADIVTSLFKTAREYLPRNRTQKYRR